MHDRKILLGGVLLVAIGAGLGLTLATVMAPAAPTSNGSTGPPADTVQFPALDATTENASVERFENASAARQYLRASLAREERDGVRGFLGGDGGFQTGSFEPTVDAPTDVRVTPDNARTELDGGASTGSPDRISDTNVQVAGLQEPDSLKTDDSHAYYAAAPQRPVRWGRPHHTQSEDDTDVLSLTPPDDPTAVASINSSGRLLRTNDTLVVIEDDRLAGYDVTDPASPEQTWTRPLNQSVVTAREANGTLYLVTRAGVSVNDPCPIEPLGSDARIPCPDVYHPGGPAPVETTYSAMAIDAASGAVGDAVSFLGGTDDTVVYMSPDALYVTYTERTHRGNLRLDFLRETQTDRLPASVRDRLAEIDRYNISAASTQREADRALEQWLLTLDEQRRERVESEIRDDWRAFLAAHQRDLVRTNVVRVGVDGEELAVETVGSVPGEPLNQFSLSEHEGRLRIATTVPGAGSAESANDLYVLDTGSLDVVGETTGMGLNERVYSVRYVGDTAYVVTFRRVDPFHVVDLSEPSDPDVVGELKLPGFSSYLHPIGDDRVLGIGEEDGQVKAVLFDVSDPSNPTVAADLLLGAHWSGISKSHHAFLLDRKHGVFFLPTGDGGKIVEYTDGDLSLAASVDTDGAAERALYVDDYMYVFGTDEVAVVDERNWTRTTTLALD